MNEVITYQNQEIQQRAQLLKGIIATLGDGPYGAEDLRAAARAYTFQPKEVQERLDFDQPLVGETINGATAIASPTSAEEPQDEGQQYGQNVIDFNISTGRAVDKKTVYANKLKSAGIFAMKAAAAVSITVLAVQNIDLYKITDRGVTAGTAPKENLADINVSLPESPSTTIEVTTTLPAPTSSLETSSVPSTETPTTTAATTVPVTEAPKPLSLTERIKAGQTDLNSHKGVYVGELLLNDLCEDVDIYIANSIDEQAPDNFPLLTADAQSKVLLLKNIDPIYFYSLTPEEQFEVLKTNVDNPNLSPEQRLAHVDDIQQSGIADGPTGKGDPMSYLETDRPGPVDCTPTLINTRATQEAYGSTEANEKGENGGFAIEYQAIADMLPEFKSLPGGGGVTYIQGHRSSQSAAFNALNQYSAGNIATYTGDDKVPHKFRMIRKDKIDGKITIDELAQKLTGDANGQEWLVLQVCIDDNPNDRALYIFVTA